MELLMLAMILIMSFYTLNLTASAPYSTNDQLALLSFKSLLSDPTGTLSSWNNQTLHPCRWRGVTCNPAEQVTALDLDSCNLAGPISPSVSNLTSLTRLYLPGNRLSGRIPEELGRLRQLRYLNLSDNALEWEIPPTLTNCSNLQNINLSRNYLRGEIPDAFASLTKLSRLHLGGNNLTGRVPSWLGGSASLTDINLVRNELTGTIPPSLGNLSSLYSLILSQNNLIGGIPPSIGNCSALGYLYLSQNRLDGSLPESLGLLTSVKEFDVFNNRLNGTVPPLVYNLSSSTFFSLGMNQFVGLFPADIGLTLPQVQTLIIRGNQFHGPIPPSLANASDIQWLDLSINMLSGPVSPNLGRLPKLNHLSLASNFLEAHDATGWNFLTSLTNCTNLQHLILSQNNLQGKLPTQVGNLSGTLQWLDLHANRLTGTIPAEVGNLLNLTLLDLSDNILAGKIPPVIGNLVSLQVLNLSHNSFSGRIPASFGGLTQLSELYLEANRLQGNIPASIGNMKELAVLNLSYNHLDGAIPKEVISISSLSQLLDLSHNSLAGSIPSEVRSLINLVHLDVSFNRLTGGIPSSLANCEELQYLYLEGNFFDGPIPDQLSNMKDIQELDLSHNNLSGHIPEFLARLTNLQFLNLSFNNFEGEVPKTGVFRNARMVSVDGNGKLCGGDPILRLLPCSIQGSDGGHKFHALKVIIPCIVVVLLVCIVFGVFVYCSVLKRKSETKLSSVSSSEGKYRKVSYNELHRATDGFSAESLIGAGSFGSVYRGKINDYDKDVAVKVLNLQQKGALKSFTAECEALRNIRHRNLVKIITSCSTIDPKGNDFRALVFEFMPNGSLEEWLHPKEDETSHLSLAQRLNITIDVASALEYLHDQGETPIVHCDLKPSNVLLDDNMSAHVGDFGLARFIDGNTSASSHDSTFSVALKGSIGYVAPEYGMGGRPSTQGDVYSYGILVLEMLTGKRPTDDLFKEGLVLRKFVEAVSPERVLEFVDQSLFSWENDGNSARERMEGCLLAMIRVGLLCSKESQDERMEIRNAVVQMHAIRAAYHYGYNR